MKRILLILASLFIAAPLHAEVPTKEPIVIGEISENKALNFLVSNQRHGFELAIDDINAKGGVLGRPIKMISRNGGDSSPSEMLRDVEELVNSKGVHILVGTIFDNNSLAVSNYARQKGIFFLKPSDGTSRFNWEEGHDLAFRFGMPNYMYGKVFAEEAAKLPAKRWAFVGPDYEFGHSVTDDFKQALKKLRPDVEFVATQWHPTFKIDAGSVVAAINHAKPDAIFVSSFGADISRLIREGNKRGLFDKRQVVHVVLGQPEHLEPLGKEAPVGWMTQGYPYDQIEAPAHKDFVAKYRARFKANPGWFSFVGYNAMISLAKAIEKAGAVEPHAIAAAMKGMTFDSLIGQITYRAADNQSNFGVWLGKLGVKDGKPTVVDWKYKSGDEYYPGDAYVKTVRPQQ